MNKVKYGQWNHTLNAFWFGGMDIEYIAWKGSHQVFIFPCGEYPQPPSGVIQHTRRIENLEEFDEAIENGITFDAKYEQVGQGVFQ